MFAMLLLPACTNRSLSKENDKLRAQRQDLQQQIASLQEKITLREGELKAVRQQLSEGATPITGVQTPRLAGIVLGLYTGPIDLDGDAKFDALRVYVRPVDQHGRQITAEGTAKITLVSLPADGSAVGTVLLEKTFDTDAFHQSYRSGVTGTHYTLAADLPQDPPLTAKLHISLTDAATGRSYTAEKQVTLVRGASE